MRFCAISVMCLFLISEGFAKVVISEFRTRGSGKGDDEFIELFNASDTPINISGYKIWGSNSTGYKSVRATIPDGTILLPRSFYLVVNRNAYSGPVQGDLSYALGITDDGGIGLTTPDGILLDAVGMSSGSAYREGVPLTPMSANQDQSYERKTATCGPDQDTDNNAADFVFNSGFSNPQNSLSCRPACAGEQCLRYPECVGGYISRTYVGECIGGTCSFTPVDTFCEFGCDPQTGLCAGDPCEGIVCTQPPNTQCYEPEGQCQQGVCIYAPLPEETLCDDGELCTVGDQCDGFGNCAGSPVVCYLRDPECVDRSTSRVYLQGVCNSTTGECEYTYLDTTCEFGCNFETGLCAGDSCAGIVCDKPPNVQCYEAIGKCVDGQCYYSPLISGASCNDGDACTLEDRCDGNGNCAGVPLKCQTPPKPKCYLREGTCVDGVCHYVPLPVGTPCDDGDLCTEDDVCTEALDCVGKPKVCEEMVRECEDADTSHLVFDLVCFPVDGICRGNSLLVQCGELGCDPNFGVCNRLPVISQFRTRGPRGGNDEFVEIFNPSAFEVDISGWTLRGSNASGTTGIRATVPQGTKMGPRTFYLFYNAANNGYSGSVQGDLKYTTGIADDGGLALVDATGKVVDAVGMSYGSAYLEGVPLAKLSAEIDQAYFRKTLACGPDWDFANNAGDFEYKSFSSPRNSKSCRPLCAGWPCVMKPKPWCQDQSTLLVYEDGQCDLENFCVYPSKIVQCDFGCSSGTCNPDPCEGVVCDEPPNDECYEEEGTCIGGKCVYTKFDEGTTCDDKDLCTQQDACSAEGFCVGIPVVCPKKEPECLDEVTSRVYFGGKCDIATGECVYEFEDFSCDLGCDQATGRCIADPCAGVICDKPPSPCHLAQGTCVGGVCVYDLLTPGTPCDDHDLCTVQDRCNEQGECAGVQMICASPPGQCFEGEGVCEAGVCDYKVLPKGTQCDDGDPCTMNDTCDGAGVCAGTPDPACAPADLGPSDVKPEVTTEGDVIAEQEPEITGPEIKPDEARADDYDAYLPLDMGLDVLEDAAIQDVQRPRKGGGGGCSANTNSFWWPSLLMFVAWLLRRKI